MNSRMRFHAEQTPPGSQERDEEHPLRSHPKTARTQPRRRPRRRHGNHQPRTPRPARARRARAAGAARPRPAPHAPTHRGDRGARRAGNRHESGRAHVRRARVEQPVPVLRVVVGSARAEQRAGAATDPRRGQPGRERADRAGGHRTLVLPVVADTELAGAAVHGARHQERCRCIGHRDPAQGLLDASGEAVSGAGDDDRLPGGAAVGVPSVRPARLVERPGRRARDRRPNRGDSPDQHARQHRRHRVRRRPDGAAAEDGDLARRRPAAVDRAALPGEQPTRSLGDDRLLVRRLVRGHARHAPPGHLRRRRVAHGLFLAAVRQQLQPVQDRPGSRTCLPTRPPGPHPSAGHLAAGHGQQERPGVVPLHGAVPEAGAVADGGDLTGAGVRRAQRRRDPAAPAADHGVAVEVTGRFPIPAILFVAGTIFAVRSSI